VSVETFSVEQIVSVTPAAANHFSQQLQKSDAKAIRLSLKESGCTGFMYVIDEVAGEEAGDIALRLENGVQLFVDAKHLSAIQGTVVDFVQQGLNQNLVLQNPNVKEACGCGESFSV